MPGKSTESEETYFQESNKYTYSTIQKLGVSKILSNYDFIQCERIMLIKEDIYNVAKEIILKIIIIVSTKILSSTNVFNTDNIFFFKTIKK